MTILTLADLARRMGSADWEGAVERRALQSRLMLAIHQRQMGLDNEAMVRSDRPLSRLLDQLQAQMPQALRPSPYLRMGLPLHTVLSMPNGASVTLQVEVNLGYRRGVPKLLDWALRCPRFGWSDAVKLWVAARYFEERHRLAPAQLKLVAIALHPTRSAQAVVFEWNGRRHRQTERWLLGQLCMERSVERSGVQAKAEGDGLMDLDAIPEVVI